MKIRVLLPPGYGRSLFLGAGGIEVRTAGDYTIVDGSAVAGTGGGSDFDTRITALESLTNGLSRTNVAYCTGGTNSTTKTVLMS